MVIVKYGEPYKKSFGKTEEKFKAKTIEELVTKIEEKYKGKEFVDTIRPYALLVYNKDTFVPKKEKDDKYVYDFDVKLKKNDEIMLMMLMGGG